MILNSRTVVGRLGLRSDLQSSFKALKTARNGASLPALHQQQSLLQPALQSTKQSNAVLEKECTQDLKKDQQQWQPPRLPNRDQSSRDAMARAADPRLFVGACIGFMLTTADIFHTSSTGFLLSIDVAVHQYATGLTTEFRNVWADLIISDTLIALGLLSWGACTVAAIASKRQDALIVLLICWGMYVWGAGWPSPPSPSFAGPLAFEPHLWGTMKHFFERARPSIYDSSFSFPSGHTCSATFLVGTLLFILLPTLMDKKQLPPGEEPTELLPKLLMSMQGSFPLLFCVGAVTAVGRCLADAHWFSDCVGGGFLGVAVVSGTAMMCQSVVVPLRQRQEADALPEGKDSSKP